MYAIRSYYGEPIEEEGDLFGATVILASRIAAKAEGGEILVADTVRGLCSGKGFLFAVITSYSIHYTKLYEKPAVPAAARPAEWRFPIGRVPGPSRSPPCPSTPLPSG